MKKLFLLILLAPFLSNPLIVNADEYVISGNGGGENTINVTASTNTTVEQQNTAEVTNNVEATADTGNNQASANSGETNIVTGNTNITSEVNNENINQSVVEIGCCQASSNITVSGNGSGSVNNVNVSNNNNTNISITNTASINNNVNGTANTGRNIANYNLGSVSIKTGNISAFDIIRNKNINIYAVDSKHGGGSVSILVKNNGAGSTNSVWLMQDDSLTTNIVSSANIINNSTWDLNTGKNSASKNNGDVTIDTGDIVFVSNIENDGINGGVIDIDCCGIDEPEEPEEPEEPDNPDQTPPPTSNGGNGGSSGGSSSSNGSSNGISTTQILPITGAPTLLVLAIVNSIMFLLGWYLRLRSGRSPNLARS